MTAAAVVLAASATIAVAEVAAEVAAVVAAAVAAEVAAKVSGDGGGGGWEWVLRVRRAALKGRR